MQKRTPDEKSNLQALARVDHSVVALVCQRVLLTDSQKKKKLGHFYCIQNFLGFENGSRLCVLDNVPVPSLEDDILVKLEANIPS